MNKLINATLISILATIVLTLSGITSANEPANEPEAPSIEQGVVNINTANAQTLATQLKGIGLKKAEAIVAYRETFGAFKSVDELAAVKGIGEKTVGENKARIILN